jgi:hypothetical protein
VDVGEARVRLAQQPANKSFEGLWDLSSETHEKGEMPEEATAHEPPLVAATEAATVASVVPPITGAAIAAAIIALPLANALAAAPLAPPSPTISPVAAGTAGSR